MGWAASVAPPRCGRRPVGGTHCLGGARRSIGALRTVWRRQRPAVACGQGGGGGAWGGETLPRAEGTSGSPSTSPRGRRSAVSAASRRPPCPQPPTVVAWRARHPVAPRPVGLQAALAYWIATYGLVPPTTGGGVWPGGGWGSVGGGDAPARRGYFWFTVDVAPREALGSVCSKPTPALPAAADGCGVAGETPRCATASGITGGICGGGAAGAGGAAVWAASVGARAHPRRLGRLYRGCVDKHGTHAQLRHP